jgi:hypothetical protein
MDDTKIKSIVSESEETINKYYSSLLAYSEGIRPGVRETCEVFKEITLFNITEIEIEVDDHVLILQQNINYRLTRIYLGGTPGIILIIMKIVSIVKTVIDVINFISDVLKITTGENLTYWINEVIPGFKDFWDDVMNKIAQFSAQLGWGVDGILHLMNITQALSYTYGIVTGKDVAWLQSEKYKRTYKTLKIFGQDLKGFQENPGELINYLFDTNTEGLYYNSNIEFTKFMESLNTNVDKVREIGTNLGSVTTEFLSMRENMPSYVAKNIPKGLWDSVNKADSVINDRILPKLTVLSERIDDMDKLLESHRKKADVLADKIAHPGDMLADINNLPEYARKDQQEKIDTVTNRSLNEANEAEYIDKLPDLREFQRISSALNTSRTPLSFMTLELPGRSTGIVAEPRETWFVGDF